MASETFTEKHWPTPATHISSFLTPEEAAIFLGGLHASTITRWAREGCLVGERYDSAASVRNALAVSAPEVVERIK